MNTEIDLLDKEINEVTDVKERPSFITVLCILTFCGAGLAIVTSLFSMLMMGQLESTMQNMNDSFGSTDSNLDLGNSYRWMKLSYIFSLAGSILCLIGALFMWRLKKNGFFIYVAGQVLPMISSFMTMNSTNMGAFSGFEMTVTIIGMMFPVAFIIMYGLNLKHMK